MTGDQLDIDSALAEFELGAVIPSRTSDPETSHAAEPVKIKAGSQRAYLLDEFYRWQMEDGLTDEQAMEYAYPLVGPTSEYAKRCSELRQGGFIEPTGEVRVSFTTGKARIVSRITEKGKAWIEANR